jgi:hypothetical protein
MNTVKDFVFGSSFSKNYAKDFVSYPKACKDKINLINFLITSHGVDPDRVTLSKIRNELPKRYQTRFNGLNEYLSKFIPGTWYFGPNTRFYLNLESTSTDVKWNSGTDITDYVKLPKGFYNIITTDNLDIDICHSEVFSLSNSLNNKEKLKKFFKTSKSSISRKEILQPWQPWMKLKLNNEVVPEGYSLTIYFDIKQAKARPTLFDIRKEITTFPVFDFKTMPNNNVEIIIHENKNVCLGICVTLYKGEKQQEIQPNSKDIEFINYCSVGDYDGFMIPHKAGLV